MNNQFTEKEINYMKEALKEANKALCKDETPIGAIIVCNDKIIAKAHNLTETLNDPTAHAEMQAITSATNYLGGKYLSQCTLYVTIEPCPMCAAALSWSQIASIIYGAKDNKRGYSIFSPSLLHPKTIVKDGLLAEECSNIVTNFFRNKR